MGREELTALIAILETERDKGSDGHVVGAWKIGYDKKRNAFVFDKCENDGYCEERPSVIALDGTVVDPGGPLFG